MRPARRRLTIAIAACGCAVLASALLHRETLRDHAEGWAFLLKHDTRTIAPLDPGEARPAAVHAMVNAVDIEEQLAILAAGKTQGVIPGDEFLLRREERIIGFARVIKTYPDLSGVRLVWCKVGQEVRRGDSASHASAGARLVAPGARGLPAGECHRVLLRDGQGPVGPGEQRQHSRPRDACRGMMITCSSGDEEQQIKRFGSHRRSGPGPRSARLQSR
jgi:hypothetical protein